MQTQYSDMLRINPKIYVDIYKETDNDFKKI